jgi:hypothetical protein
MLLLGLALLATPAAAHHTLANYDHGKSISLDGVVTGFRFAHPHPHLLFTVGKEQWEGELDNLAELQGVGMTRDTFRPADKIRISGMPDRHGAKAVYIRSLDRSADGLHYEQPGSHPALKTRPKS